jgi:UDP-GlcNAc:undecaprenyl-phosphate GlcNAc-1-phosphate transferase
MSPLLALGLGLLLTPALGLLGRRVGLLDRPSDDALKIHVVAKPLTGGIGVVAATLVAIAVSGGGLDPVVAAAVLFMLAVGVVDDVVSLAPPVRLAAELAAGAMLAAAGVTFAPLGDLGSVAVVLAVPAAANAVNVSDGQDGLAGGLAGVAALGMFAIATNGVETSLGLTLAAALAAFLVWNRPPASIFLGDGGAYGVAVLLVLVAAEASRTARSMVGAIVCLAPFGLEMASTMLRRAFARTLAGDRAHIYDLLAQRLAGRGRSTLTILMAGAAAAALGWLCSRMPLAAAVGVLVATVIVGSLAVRTLWRSQGVRLRRLRERTAEGG